MVSPPGSPAPTLSHDFLPRLYARTEPESVTRITFTPPAGRHSVRVSSSPGRREITRRDSVGVSPLAAHSSRRGLPWFDSSDDPGAAREDSKILKSLEAIVQPATQKGDTPLSESESAPCDEVITLRRRFAGSGARGGVLRGVGEHRDEVSVEHHNVRASKRWEWTTRTRQPFRGGCQHGGPCVLT